MSTDKVETALEYSILKVPADGGTEHTILITTSIRTASFVLQSKDQQAVTLDILATYIDGPITPDNFEAGFICRMGGHVDTHNNKVKLTNSAVVVVPCMQGFGIGTFLFNQVVCWAKKHDPQLEVAPIRVAATDATEGNQTRRNMFYAHFNILFSDSPTNEGVVEAYSIPMRVSDLTPHVSKKNNIQEQSIELTLRLMVDKQRELLGQNRDLVVSLQGKDRVIAQRDRSKAGTVKTLLGIIGVLCLALWWRW
jgi:GNAT superfamily N-acetyltransferase